MRDPGASRDTPALLRTLPGVASGLLAALALPPFDVWPFAFVALVPLAVALTDPRVEEGTAASVGVAFGAVFYGILLHWVPATLHGMGPLGALSGVLFIGLLAGVGGVQALLLRRLALRGGVPAVVALPAVFTGTELFLAHLGPFSLPWISLALGLSSVPELAGIAESIGARGVTFWIASVNGGLAWAIVTGRQRAGRPARPRGRGYAGASPGSTGVVGLRASAIALLAALLAVAPALWGVRRAERLPTAPTSPVLVAQLAISRDELVNRSRRDEVALAAVHRVLGARSLSQEPFPPNPGGSVAAPVAPALAILPEAPWRSTWDAGLDARFREYAAGLGVPLLVGTLASARADPPGSGSPSFPGASAGESRLADGAPIPRANAVLLVAEGEETRRVHTKARLVPGIEWPALTAGSAGEVLGVDDLRLGILICFEVAFSSETRRLRAAGADLLVNPSNDGWFRPRWDGLGSFALAQHRAHLVLRAVETRMGAVRSSVGGELLVVEPTGRVTVSRAAGEEDLVRVVPRTTSIVTGFVRFGDWVGVLAVLLLAGLLLRPDPRDSEGEPV